MTTVRPSFASKSAYESLVIESGEDTESEEELEPTPQPDVPVKPSKSAMKKAAKLARTERKQQQKALAKAQRQLNSDSPTSTGTPSDSPRAMASSLEDGLALLKAAAQPSQPPPSITVKPKEAQSIPVPISATVKETSIPPAVAPPQPNGVVANKAVNIEEPVPAANRIPKSSVSAEPPRPEAPPSAPMPVPQKTQPAPSLPRKDTGTLAMEKQNPPAPTPQEAEKQKKKRNVFERTLWTVIMIAGFLTLLLLGHAYMILLVMLCQTIVYREVTALFSLKSSTPESDDAEVIDEKDPWSKTLNWYFFAVTNYFLYGESIVYYFKHVVFVDAQLTLFATNHRIISFTLYTIGFVGFVMSLKKGYLKQQFGLFCWVHMSLLLIVVSSHFIVNNILEGLIWFWVPASLVICNDVFAYIWGITIGRTPLIALSPKKTVEGFVGAFWSTIVFGIFWGTYFMQFDYMICPVRDLGVSAWTSVTCTPNPVFVWQDLELWKPVSIFLSQLFGRSITTIPYATYHVHLLVMSIFAALVAPFGGFFASGFKRAFNIKDFGDSIPGHGGMTDRMDCQFLMGVFTYVYYTSFIRDAHITVGSVLQTVVSGLTVDEQLQLIADLKRYLQGRGISVP
jgi:phosphatidate cytidylyltransferase